jgi:hypothetical protein
VTQTSPRVGLADYTDYTTIFAGVAIVVGVVNLYLYYTQVKAGKPRIDFAVSNGNYTIIGEPASKEAKTDVRITCTVLFKNDGNAPGSVNDAILRMRYYRGLQGHPLGKKLLGSGSQSLGGKLKEAGGMSNRPTNFSESIPIHIEPYGTSKATFIFDFAGVYSYYLDRATGPIDPDHPEVKAEWRDQPIVIELTAATPSGLLDRYALLFRTDQPESKEHSGFINQWDSLNKDIKFVGPDED